jgi:hypothetical protein
MSLAEYLNAETDKHRPPGLYKVDRRDLSTLLEARLLDMTMAVALHDKNPIGCDACFGYGQQSASHTSGVQPATAAALTDAAAKLATAEAEFKQFQREMDAISSEQRLRYTRTAETLRAALDECRHNLEQARLAALADPANVPPDEIGNVHPRKVGAMHIDACLKFSTMTGRENRPYQRVVRRAPCGAH